MFILNFLVMEIVIGMEVVRMVGCRRRNSGFRVCFWFCFERFWVFVFGTDTGVVG